MQLRWNFKLEPNQIQTQQLSQWLITLRKHRNYALKERETGYNANNQYADDSIIYAWGSWCDINSKNEYGSCCPLTCPVVKHGVVPSELNLALKISKGSVKWDNASGIQMKMTTRLRHERQNFREINSDVLQRNISRLDTAFSNFWKHGRGFPRYKRVLTSFEYKPGQVKIIVIKDTYAIIHLPGIGNVKMHNSRDLTSIKKVRTCTIKRSGGYWFISMLVDIPGELAKPKPIGSATSAVGIDVGVNKLIAISDGSFVENIRATTSHRTARRFSMRQRAASHKRDGSRNKTKAYK